MIKAYLANISKSRSLTAKIREAEQQLLIRQREVGVRTDTLIKKIHRQMTAPSTLLLTVGIGFILGELTKRQTAGNHGVAGKQSSTGASPLRIALNFLSTAHTLYAAMPIAWRIKYFRQPRASDRQAQPVPAASGAARNRRR